ncbi:hypothetical protein [Hufsiella arboris]|nr:hypothetical protein [Hufsiella arboris]
MPKQSILNLVEATPWNEAGKCGMSEEYAENGAATTDENQFLLF